MTNLPFPDLDYRLKPELTPADISESLELGRRDRTIELCPLKNGRVAVYNRDGALEGIWTPTHEEYQSILFFSTLANQWITSRRRLYEDALRGGEPSSSQLARDLRAARQEPRHVVKTPVELLDL